MKKKAFFNLIIPAVFLLLLSSVLQSCAPGNVIQESSDGSASEASAASKESSSESQGAIIMSIVPAQPGTEDAEESGTEPGDSPETSSEASIDNPPENAGGEKSSLRILAVGDMLMHAGITNQALVYGGGETPYYDFLFENIREDLLAADLRIVNNEVIFGGDELGALGYPYFSVPTSLGDSEYRSGFNVILSANNHTNDQGPSGIRNTLNFWKKYPDAALLGIHESPESFREVRVLEKNGIRIAMINLTYGLNIDWFPDGEDYLVEKMTEDQKPEIARKLVWAEENADFTIVFPHWGQEYELSANAEQKAWAQFFTENGADLIIGSHTHTVQEDEWITAWNGETSYCAYSLGNFVSLQAMTINMLGKMPVITIEKGLDGCRITNVENRYTLTWFDKNIGDVHVYRMDQVTDELLSMHGVVGSVHSEYYDEMNAAYPMTMDVLRSLCR